MDPRASEQERHRIQTPSPELACKPHLIGDGALSSINLDLKKQSTCVYCQLSILINSLNGYIFDSLE
ncbi:hypothetical protein LWI28_029155 [Acer negundo]|uniref:Uncharacterized protein n=1 Tax=Acer negundo TaxID=4023 RepID=A0AAD5JGH0_ACENE|nr:hypothetical protein LWI28_029155 [Acer negundo]